MTTSENKQLKKINTKITWGIGIIFIILLAYFPLINANTKKSQQAYDKAENVENLLNVKMDAVIEKLDIVVNNQETEIENIKKAIENNRLNHAEVASKLLEKGYVRDLTFRNGTVN